MYQHTVSEYNEHPKKTFRHVRNLNEKLMNERSIHRVCEHHEEIFHLNLSAGGYREKTFAYAMSPLSMQQQTFSRARNSNENLMNERSIHRVCEHHEEIFHLNLSTNGRFPKRK